MRMACAVKTKLNDAGEYADYKLEETHGEKPLRLDHCHSAPAMGGALKTHP